MKGEKLARTTLRLALEVPQGLMDFHEILAESRQYISLLDYDSRFFLFMSCRVVFTEISRN